MEYLLCEVVRYCSLSRLPEPSVLLCRVEAPLTLAVTSAYNCLKLSLPAGAGKTTLMDVLASRKTGEHLIRHKSSIKVVQTHLLKQST